MHSTQVAGVEKVGCHRRDDAGVIVTGVAASSS